MTITPEKQAVSQVSHALFKKVKENQKQNGLEASTCMSVK